MFLRITLISLVVAILGYYFLSQPNPISVKVVAIEVGQVQTTVANTRVGTVKPCRRAFLAPAVGDKLTKLNVREGDVVKQGQLLMEVWNHGLQAQIGLRQAEIINKQALAVQACHLADGAQRDAGRKQKLRLHKQVISEEQVDDAITEALAKKAACQAARAAVEVSKASLIVAQVALERSWVRAPFDGTVAEVNVELGEYVTPSPPGIATLPAIDLLDTSCLYISAPIDEVDAPLLKLGMSACVSLDAFTGKRCSGTVTRIAPYVLEKEKQARTVEVEVTLVDSKDIKGLLPGYSADIEVLVESKEKTLRIPTETIMEGNHVLVLQDGIIQQRSFKPGLSNWAYTEVLSGLESGEQVVVSLGRDGVQVGARAQAE